MMEANKISRIALSFFCQPRMDTFEHKTWAGYALMDAAMVRLQNPELPYTDISKRFFHFIIKRSA